MMGTLYLGALKAASAHGGAPGRPASAPTRTARIFESGRERLDRSSGTASTTCRGSPAGPSEVKPLLSEPRTSRGTRHAVVDGQLALPVRRRAASRTSSSASGSPTVVGLGHAACRPSTCAAPLGSIYRYNFRHDFFEHPNAQRIYALNDEKGLLLCSWPQGRAARASLRLRRRGLDRHRIPGGRAPHLRRPRRRRPGRRAGRARPLRRPAPQPVERGRVRLPLRARPVELVACCSRSPASPGRRPSAACAFAPRVNASDFRCFFSAGTGWGVFSQRLAPREGFTAGVATRYGEVRLRHLHLANTPRWPAATLRSATGPAGEAIPGASVRLEGRRLRDRPRRRGRRGRRAVAQRHLGGPVQAFVTGSSACPYRGEAGASGVGPMYRAPGRINRPESRCSRTWAHQPATRATAKVGQNSSRGKPTASRRSAV